MGGLFLCLLNVAYSIFYDYTHCWIYFFWNLSGWFVQQKILTSLIFINVKLNVLLLKRKKIRFFSPPNSYFHIYQFLSSYSYQINVFVEETKWWWCIFYLFLKQGWIYCYIKMFTFSYVNIVYEMLNVNWYNIQKTLYSHDFFCVKYFIFYRIFILFLLSTDNFTNWLGMCSSSVLV